MPRLCEKCQRMRDYHPMEKRNSMFSGFYKNICWDCHTTEQILKELAKKRERQYANIEQSGMRARYASSEAGKEARKRAQKRYMQSEKGKAANRAAQARYRAKTAPINPAPKAQRESLPTWLLKPQSPEDRKAAQKAYQQSDKGKAANRAAQARYRAKKALPEWLK